ncbi:hypothetical protein HG531_006589 [Fusarium graminearum]|nr:hypothetical protein HG531_006589 [Fusarium graminearum]
MSIVRKIIFARFSCRGSAHGSGDAGWCSRHFITGVKFALHRLFAFFNLLLGRLFIASVAEANDVDPSPETDRVITLFLVELFELIERCSVHEVSLKSTTDRNVVLTEHLELCAEVETQCSFRLLCLEDLLGQPREQDSKVGLAQMSRVDDVEEVWLRHLDSAGSLEQLRSHDLGSGIRTQDASLEIEHSESLLGNLLLNVAAFSRREDGLFDSINFRNTSVIRALHKLRNSGCSEAVPGKDNAARLVNVGLADKLIKAGRGSIQVGQFVSTVNRDHSLVNKTKLPASNSELGFTGLVDLRADIVRDLFVMNLNSVVGCDCFVLLLGYADETGNSAAIAVLGADYDDAMRGERAGDHGTKTQEFGIGDQMLSLRVRQPADTLLVRFGHGWVEHAILDGLNLVGTLGGGAGGFEFGNGDLDINGADFVRARVFGEGWDRA